MFQLYVIEKGIFKKYAANYVALYKVDGEELAG